MAAAVTIRSLTQEQSHPFHQESSATVTVRPRTHIDAAERPAEVEKVEKVDPIPDLVASPSASPASPADTSVSPQATRERPVDDEKVSPLIVSRSAMLGTVRSFAQESSRNVSNDHVQDEEILVHDTAPPSIDTPPRSAWVVPIDGYQFGLWTNPAWLLDENDQQLRTWRRWHEAWNWAAQHQWTPLLWTPRAVLEAIESSPRSPRAMPWHLGQVGLHHWVVWQGSPDQPILARNRHNKIWLARSVEYAQTAQNHWHARLYAPSALRVDVAQVLAQQAPTHSPIRRLH